MLETLLALGGEKERKKERKENRKQGQRATYVNFRKRKQGDGVGSCSLPLSSQLKPTDKAGSSELN